MHVRHADGDPQPDEAEGSHTNNSTWDWDRANHAWVEVSLRSSTDGLRESDTAPDVRSRPRKGASALQPVTSFVHRAAAVLTAKIRRPPRFLERTRTVPLADETDVALSGGHEIAADVGELPGVHLSRTEVEAAGIIAAAAEKHRGWVAGFFASAKQQAENRVLDIIAKGQAEAASRAEMIVTSAKERAEAEAETIIEAAEQRARATARRIIADAEAEAESRAARILEETEKKARDGAQRMFAQGEEARRFFMPEVAFHADDAAAMKQSPSASANAEPVAPQTVVQSKAEAGPQVNYKAKPTPLEGTGELVIEPPVDIESMRLMLKAISRSRHIRVLELKGSPSVGVCVKLAVKNLHALPSTLEALPEIESALELPANTRSPLARLRSREPLRRLLVVIRERNTSVTAQ